VRRALFAAVLVLHSPSGEAQTDSDAQGAAIEEFTVIGRYPGPPLWKVVHGEHVLWIFGNLTPLPKRMTWGSQTVEAVIARSQEVIAEPSLRVREYNPIKLIKLFRQAKRLAKNPEEATLATVLPPDIHARYSALKARYAPRDRDMDELRPGLVAGMLLRRAIDDAGLAVNQQVVNGINKIARRQDVDVTQSRIVAKPQDLLADLAEISSAAEIACFDTIMKSIEIDLDAMRARANAWAIGEMELLRRFDYPAAEADCWSALETAEGLQALKRQADAEWLASAERALTDNMTTFAVLPMRELLEADGLLEQLRARGYAVQEP
jgi:uncharacterized protein YbaP (TraB family)